VIVLDDATRQLIRESAQADAASITNTYNRDLRSQINQILTKEPNIDRKGVLERLSAWNFGREQWKNPQVSLNSNRRGAQMALDEFYRRNKDSFRVTMKVMPRTAVCEFCQALIDMGTVDWSVAQANPCPLHVNCNHGWVTVGMEQIGPIYVDSLLQRLVNRILRR
jgi:hypothetical protein